MLHLVRRTVFFATAALLAACTSSVETGEAQNVESGQNLDVQVVRAKAGSSPIFLNGHPLVTPHDCEFSRVEDDGNDKGTAEADCTDEMMQGAALPAFTTYVEPIAWVRFLPDTQHIVGESFRHWCTEARVVVAVKAAAWDAASFEGIGFWSYDESLAPREEDQRVFYAKDDPRLVRQGEATLKSGDRAYLYEFVGAGPCAVNGTGDNPGHELVFKPFVTFAGGYERWEAVDGNHGLRHRASWDRSADLLQ